MYERLDNAVNKLNKKHQKEISSAAKKVFAVTNDSIDLMKQLHEKIDLTYFGLEDAIAACHYKNKISSMHCNEAIASEYALQIKQRRTQNYGKKACIMNAILWPLDRFAAKKLASKYVHEILYSYMRQTGKERFRWPWWHGMISVYEKLAMEIVAKNNTRKQRITELEAELEQINASKTGTPEDHTKKHDLDKEIKDFYKKLDSENNE